MGHFQQESPLHEHVLTYNGVPSLESKTNWTGNTDFSSNTPTTTSHANFDNIFYEHGHHLFPQELQHFLSASTLESIRETMIKHEKIFKEQVQALHSLYSCQISLTVDLSKSFINVRNLPASIEGGQENTKSYSNFIEGKKRGIHTTSEEKSPRRLFDLEKTPEEFIDNLDENPETGAEALQRTDYCHDVANNSKTHHRTFQNISNTNNGGSKEQISMDRESFIADNGLHQSRIMLENMTMQKTEFMEGAESSPSMNCILSGGKQASAKPTSISRMLMLGHEYDMKNEFVKWGSSNRIGAKECKTKEQMSDLQTEEWCTKLKTAQPWYFQEAVGNTKSINGGHCQSKCSTSSPDIFQQDTRSENLIKQIKQSGRQQLADGEILSHSMGLGHVSCHGGLQEKKIKDPQENFSVSFGPQYYNALGDCTTSVSKSYCPGLSAPSGGFQQNVGAQLLLKPQEHFLSSLSSSTKIEPEPNDSRNTGTSFPFFQMYPYQNQSMIPSKISENCRSSDMNSSITKELIDSGGCNPLASSASHNRNFKFIEIKDQKYCNEVLPVTSHVTKTRNNNDNLLDGSACSSQTEEQGVHVIRETNPDPYRPLICIPSANVPETSVKPQEDGSNTFLRDLHKKELLMAEAKARECFSFISGMEDCEQKKDMAKHNSSNCIETRSALVLENENTVEGIQTPDSKDLVCTKKGSQVTTENQHKAQQCLQYIGKTMNTVNHDDITEDMHGDDTNFKQSSATRNERKECTSSSPIQGRGESGDKRPTHEENCTPVSLVSNNLPSEEAHDQASTSDVTGKQSRHQITTEGLQNTIHDHEGQAERVSPNQEASCSAEKATERQETEQQSCRNLAMKMPPLTNAEPIESQEAIATFSSENEGEDESESLAAMILMSMLPNKLDTKPVSFSSSDSSRESSMSSKPNISKERKNSSKCKRGRERQKEEAGKWVESVHSKRQRTRCLRSYSSKIR